MGILGPRSRGSIPGVAGHLVWDGGQLRDSVSLDRIDQALNRCLEKSGKGKLEGYAKAQDGWPAPFFISWLKAHEVDISTAGLDLKGLVPSYLLTFIDDLSQGLPLLPQGFPSS